MVHNVLASWAAHLVFFVAGFVMPRMTDRYLGQEALGVWDFGWSLVSYFGLVQVGIGGAVIKYVAMHRATGNIASVNRAVSSAQCFQAAAALLALGGCLGAALLLPALFSGRFGLRIGEAQWIVLLLGATISAQLLLNPFDAVLAGCHRWGVRSIINAGGYAIITLGMIAALLTGGGLRALAGITLGGQVLTECVRVIAAHVVCRGLHVRLRKASWSVLVEMVGFGGKSLLSSVSNLLLYQTNSIMVAAFLGPGALALYSRPRSLVGQMQTLVNRFAFVLMPTASSLYARECRQDLKHLLVRSSQFALYMAVPAVLALAIMGDLIVRLWMGPQYQLGLLTVVLAVGTLGEMVGEPASGILAGLNMHGRMGVAGLLGAITSAVLCLVALKVMGWGLEGAAIALVLPLMVTKGIWVPLHSCHRIGVPVHRFLSAWAGPLLLSLPFACSLAVARVWLGHRPVLALASGLGLGGTALAILYWRYVLPRTLRDGIVGTFRRLRGPSRAQTVVERPRT